MKRAVIFLFAIAVMTVAMTAAEIASGGNKLDIREVEAIVLRVVPDVTVESVSMSPLPGMYEVVIDTSGGKGILYLSSDMKHVIVGSIIDMQQGRNLTEARFTELSRVDFSSIPLDDALVLGNPRAKHKVIVLDDPD